MKKLVAVLLFAVPLFAADLGKYQDWDTTPQSYFMTKAERAQWSGVRTEGEAETFVNAYLAARGPAFPDELAKRIAQADKYLTIGKTPGSQTLRGKVIVLLGPPTTFRQANREVEGPRSAPIVSGMGGGGDRGGQGASVADMAAAAERQGMSGKSVREFTIGYEAKKLPPSFDSDLTVIVQADQVTGKDKLADSKQQKDLDTLFEMVAQASLKK